MPSLPLPQSRAWPRPRRARKGRPAAGRRRARAAVVEAFEPRWLLASTLVVGDHTLLPNTAGQTVKLFVSGNDNVEGMTLNAQVADGGPEVGGSINGPNITAADIVTGTIFASNNTGQVNPGSFPGLAIRTITTNSGTVAANGLLATLTLDTTGFTAGTWDLKLKGTRNGDSDFVFLPINITNGRILVGTSTKPTITVTAPDAAAAEAALNPGTFTFTRSGSTTSSLAVRFGVGGTAANGTDYNTLATTVTIPAGSASANVTVTPKDDATAEASETVVLTLSSDAAYNVGSPGSATVTIADNDGGTSTGSISGTVYHDVNASGVRDAGEPAQANWRVYLDADKDGVFDSTERNTLTDSAGVFRFTGLPAGSHRVREVVQSGYRISTPTAFFYDVTLASGQAVTARNFGNTQRVLISGLAYNDLSGNGSRVSTEPVIAGRTVYLDADNDGVLDTGEARTTTDSAGKYAFKTLTAGTYRVREVMPAGWRRTQPATTSNGGSYVLTLASGASATARDFGSTQKVLISGSVFNDANGDRVRQSTEAGLANWRIYVDADNDGVLDAGEASTLTDASGNWKFTGLAAGSYVIRVVQQTGFTRTTPTTGTPAGSFNFSLTSGQTRSGLLFGERRTT